MLVVLRILKYLPMRRLLDMMAPTELTCTRHIHEYLCNDAGPCDLVATGNATFGQSKYRVINKSVHLYVRGEEH